MKNKEIEELLNKAKDIAKYGADGKQHTRMFNQFEAKALLSYIEQLENDNKDLDKENQMLFEKNLQLETDYKEANESVIWWQNRYNAIVKQNDDNHKKVVKLENNRDKAIELLNKLETQPAYLDCKYYELYGFNEIKNILGDKND